MKNHIIFLLAFFYFNTSFSQTLYKVYDSIDINNFKATMWANGVLWEKPNDSFPTYPIIKPACQFPQGSKANIATAGALWFAGLDAGNNLHVSSQEFINTYADSGYDYWPGPLDPVTKTIDYTNSGKWAKIWKIYQATIDSFNLITTHTLSNTPRPILEWPAKGNPYAKGNGGISLTISNDMAPFVDVDHDGVYDPLKGDYPAIKGEEALWWVFNDNGPTHNHSKGQSLQIEIHAMVYAYRRWNMIDNVVYYDYTIVNRSSNNYHKLRVGQWADFDIGWAFDDYIGCDISRRLGIVYNGNMVDGSGGPGTYGTAIPIVGITMVHLPGDTSCTNYSRLGDFIYYNNDFTAIGNPLVDTEYYHYLNASLRNGEHYSFDWNGLHGSKSKGYGSGPDTNYLYPGNPEDTTQWSECNSSDLAYDRRIVIASGDFNLNAGSSENIVMALVAYPNQKGCPIATFDTIRMVTDTAWYYYCHPPATLPLSIVNQNSSTNNLNIYPNPAHNILNIETNGVYKNDQETIIVYDIMGRQMNIPFQKNEKIIKLDINNLPNGIYMLSYNNGIQQQNHLFVKE